MSRTPLWARLLLALTSLLVVGLGTTAMLTLGALRSYLTQRVDTQLVDAAASLTSELSSSEMPQSSPGVQLPSQFHVRILDSVGVVRLEVSSPLGSKDVPPLTSSHSATPFYLDGQHRWRAVVSTLPRGFTLVVATPLDEEHLIITRLRAILVAVSLVSVAFLAGFGFVLVRTSLRPLASMRTTAERIAAGDLGQRAAQDGPPEVHALARAFNSMLSSLSGALATQAQLVEGSKATTERMRRFVSDASHELRTPLTTIRGFAELYRQGAVRDPQAVARSFARIEAEATRMGLLVEDLLTLARLDEARPDAHAPVDVLVLAIDAVDDALARNDDHPVTLSASGPPAVVIGDDARLRQVLTNLVSNALAHTPAGTPVHVSVDSASSLVTLTVRDQGPGISDVDARQVFERFYRTDPSRARDTGGSGLGLSIVAAIVAAHGGQVVLETAPGRGAAFKVMLPAAP